MDEQDLILSDLAYRFLNRKPLKSITVDSSENPLLVEMKDLVEKAGFNPRYYTAINSSYDLPYDLYHPEKGSHRTQIELMQKDGSLIELSKASQLVSALTGQGQGDVRFYYPKEMTQLDSKNSDQLNLTTAQVQKVMEPAKFESTKVIFENGKMKNDGGDSGTQFILSFLTTIIMFVFIVSYSSIIAQEIASEKGTRIMEVLLSSMKAKTHYYGKLLGVLLVALTQLLIYGVAIVLGYRQFKDMDMVKDLLSNVSIKALLGSGAFVIITFMLVGLFLYAVLSALCGSLVSKPEDTAKAIQPVTYLSMIGYMLSLILGTSDPTNVIIKVTSYIPFLSSYSMPLRLASGTVALSSAFVSLAILVLFTIFLTLFSAQLYKSNVLVYSEGGTWSALKQSISIMQNDRKKK